MTKKDIIKKINNTNWYRQGGELVPYYPSTAYRAAFILYDGFNFYQGTNNYGYFNKDKEKDFCQKIIKQQIKNKKYIIKSLFKPWLKLKKEQDFYQKITQKSLSILPETKFINLHKRFSDLGVKIWRIGALIEAFDPWGKTFVNEYLSKYNLDILDNDLAVLVGPTKLNFNQKELLDRLQITKKLIQKKDIQAEVLKHTQKYNWINNSWSEVYYLNKDYFIKSIRKDSKKEKKIINKQIRDLQIYEIEAEKKVGQLIKKYQIPLDFRNILYLFSVMSDWRDIRKAQMMKMNSVVYLFLKELSRRTKIDKKYLFYLDAYEITSLKHLKTIKGELKKRQKYSIYYIIGKTGIKWFTGREALSIHNLLEKQISQSKEIKGTIANKGKVIGRVKVIITKKDFKKIKSGDILVTQMTRPEHISIMKKAGAIITDEGGVTCHAAIISRELNIPCIIGTQIATSVLKDKQLVEVDANKGVVKKLGKRD